MTISAEDLSLADAVEARHGEDAEAIVGDQAPQKARLALGEHRIVANNSNGIFCTCGASFDDADVAAAHAGAASADEEVVIVLGEPYRGTRVRDQSPESRKPQ